MDESTSKIKRTTGDVVGMALLHILSWASVAIVAAMAYGMVLDGAAFMLPFPILLAPVALGLVVATGAELVTGDSVGVARRLRDRLRR